MNWQGGPPPLRVSREVELYLPRVFLVRKSRFLCTRSLLLLTAAIDTASAIGDPTVPSLLSHVPLFLLLLPAGPGVAASAFAAATVTYAAATTYAATGVPAATAQAVPTESIAVGAQT